jgi:tetratricopeptide (TPR) repeat protein
MIFRLTYIFSLSLLLASFVSTGQDADKSLKNAQKSMSLYNLDSSKKGKLAEAKMSIDEAYQQMDSESKQYDILLARGEIYNQIATEIFNIYNSGLGQLSDLPSAKNPAITASQSLREAVNYADKKYRLVKCETNLAKSRQLLHNLGINCYDRKEYPEAFSHFVELLDMKMSLEEHNLESWSLEDNQSHRFIAGASAYHSGDHPNAIKHFEILANEGYTDNVFVYSTLFSLVRPLDLSKAESFLVKGRELFPKDITLLYAEINLLLELGKHDELLEIIDVAIAADRSNPSLYVVKGNVYEQLWSTELAAGNEAIAAEYFDTAIKTYSKGLEAQVNYDLLYNIGALYYNRAAHLTTKMESPMFSTPEADLEVLASIRSDFKRTMNQALSHFLLAENIDDSNVELLKIIHGVYIHLERYDQAKNYSDRISAMGG